MKNGLFIAFDGVNGAGKSTCMQRTFEHLQALGFDVVKTREPGGTPISEQIRSLVLSPESSSMIGITELMLFAAARAQHVSEVILPAIEQSKIVLCDRWTSSSVSFQQYGKGLPREMVQALNVMALQGLVADLNIVFDLDPKVGASRVVSRGEDLERFELLEMAFHQRVRQGFLDQVLEDPKRFRLIDASGDRDAVFSRVMRAVKPLITDRLSTLAVNKVVAPVVYESQEP